MDRFLGEDGGVFKGPYISIKHPTFVCCQDYGSFDPAMVRRRILNEIRFKVVLKV